MTPRCATVLLALLPALALPSTVLGAPPPEPEMRRIVLEDDAVRIEEVRVRGQVQRISVTPKAAGARPFEIVPADPARDVSQQRGLTGQRLWNLFSF
jgi:hypothetical protein